MQISAFFGRKDKRKPRWRAAPENADLVPNIRDEVQKNSLGKRSRDDKTEI